jgi:hypothetical protein
MASQVRPVTVVWRPQPGPQIALLRCPFFEVFFGGARGGGKTDGMLGEWAGHAQRYGEHAIGVFFRRTLKQLEEAIARSHQLYGPLGAKWHESKSTWTFPNRARLKFRYLERDADAEEYQGHSYTRVYIEELTNFPDPGPVMKLMATLRSGAGVPGRFRATGNPGGPGHNWVKMRYIDPAPAGYVPIASPPDPETGEILKRVFIPSRLQDNSALMSRDRTYVSRLRLAGSDTLVRAWLDGDWSVIQGAFFDNWRPARHVIRPFTIPKSWPRFRAFDWGGAKPFAALWGALSDGSIPGIPRGCIVIYREWYGCVEGQANVGLKMRNEKIAEGIVERTGDEEMADSVADPAIFTEAGGPSIGEVMYRAGAQFRRADHKRIPGWQQVRGRLEGNDDGEPMLLVTTACPHLIRTLPALQHDEHDPEDVDSESEDHAPDTLRYLCMTRPYHRPVPVERSPEIDTRLPTFNELMAIHERQAERRI